jgi:myxalamid-type nonribosomal peptide synthetase MxaA
VSVSRSIDHLTPEQKRALLADLLRRKSERQSASRPLSQGQRALWFLHELSPDSAAYHVTIALRIRSGLNVDAFKRSLQALVDRHESMRTTFQSSGGTPTQTVHRHLALPIDEVDASGWTADEVDARLMEEAHRPFDLEKGPLLRVSLYRRPATEHIFLMTVHHIVYDVVSFIILLDELRVLYAAELLGTPAALPPLPATYGDFVHRQTEMLAGPEGERLWSYWKTELEPPHAVSNLPTDRPRPSIQTFEGAACPFALTSALTRDVKALARAAGVTPYMILLAAFQALLHRYSGADDILVGTPTSGRSRAEFEGIVGYFINPVVIRTNVAAAPTFADLLGRVRHTVLGALEHADYPFPLLVERLHPARDLSRSPIFQVMFNVPKAQRLEDQGAALFAIGDAAARMQIGGLDVELHPVVQKVAMFDLLLAMVESQGQWAASLQYNSALFDAGTIDRMIGHFQTLLEGAIADPSLSLSQLPLLSAAERRAITLDWNDTDIELPLDRSFCDLFEAQVERTPRAVAALHGDQALTYEALNAHADHLAQRLIAQGVGIDTIVGVLARRSLNLLTSLLAILKAGAAYLPLDPDWPIVRVTRLLEISGSAIVLADSSLHESLLHGLTETPSDNQPCILAIDGDSSRAADGQTARRPEPRDLAYVIYTSGSTGEPKGAMIEHRGMVNHLHSKIRALALTSADTVAQTASQCFDISVWQLLAPLLVGGRVRIFDDEVTHDPSRLMKEAEAGNVTVLEVVPSLLRAVLNDGEDRHATGPLLVGMRWLICTGEALPPDLCRDWHARYPHVPIMNAYGPTECSDDVLHHVVDASVSSTLRAIPIGRPIPNARLYIVDANLQPVPIGVIGELCVGGACVGRGYLHDPVRTAETFLPDPFDNRPDRRMYRTGDLCRYAADGTIEFIGRRDYQVKVRGTRVEVGEIEAVLALHPMVREAVVVARGADDTRDQLVAYVVSREESLTAQALRSFVGERLPAVMVPAAFVSIDAMPLTRTGKIDRNALPAPDWSRRNQVSAFVGPRTPLEEELAEIWRTVLKLERVGVHENFFDLGGHSLLAAQIVSRIRERIHPDLKLMAFLELSTIARLADSIDHAEGGVAPGAFDERDSETLVADASLELSIQPARDVRSLQSTTRPVLLTGATGFLGAYLLHDLLRRTDERVACFIRPDTHQSGIARIRRSLERYRIWDDSFESRIVAVEGDLRRPLLGLTPERFEQLAAETGAIYHSAALVNFLYPYAALKSTNVDGTRELLRLACVREPKTMHFVSTVSILTALGIDSDRTITEACTLDSIRYLVGGYAQSKWVAEKMIETAGSRGLTVRTYRPHWITGHSRSGACSTDDLMFQVFKHCIRMGTVPDLDVYVQMTPVDYVSSAIVHLAGRSDLEHNVFHLDNHQPAPLGDVVEWIRAFGYDLRLVSARKWLSAVAATLTSAAELQALSTLLTTNADRDDIGKGMFRLIGRLRRVDGQRTLDGLGGSGIACHPVDQELLHTYLSYLVNVGFLAAPDRSRSVTRVTSPRLGV